MIKFFVGPLVLGAIVARLPAGARGPTPFRLDSARIDAVFAAYGRATPGCALGIYREGRVVYAKGYGMADLNLDVPIGPATVFDIGSTSKQFAAASVILLANEGKLALDDDVRQYVPELPSYGRTITIDHMLRHTSGLRDYNGLLYLKGYRFEDATGDEEAMDVIVRQRALNFEPGTRWDYSNTGFFLLSVIVKRVTGKTLAEFAKERFFDPLDMTVTNFRDDHTAILRGRATGYSPRPGGAYQIDMSDWDQLGDGAVNTTVLELARWDQNFYTAEVGGRALIDRLVERGTLNDGDSLDYARGLVVDTYRGLRRIHHGGAWAGYRAMLMRFPEQRISIATLCNRGDANTSKLAQSVADVVLEDVLGPKSSPAAKARGSKSATTGREREYLGLYFGEMFQAVARVSLVDGRLTLNLNGRPIPLEAAGGARYEADGFPVAAEFGNDTMNLWLSNESQGTFRKVTPVTPSAAELERLVGSYYSPELATTWEIVMKEGKPAIKARAFGLRPLEPAMADGFTVGPGFARFTRDEGGQLTGFELSASRMQRIRFDRKEGRTDKRSDGQ